MKAYQDEGPVHISESLCLQSLRRKSVIVTGGASGLGKAYVEAFAKAGSFVTIADFNETAGQDLANSLDGQAIFVKCDVRQWEDQVRVFETAVRHSPARSCDVVVANAGIIGKDDLYLLQDPLSAPEKPNLDIVEINLLGSIYTAKLAMHYFRRQPLSNDRDRCLILKASISAYIDCVGSPQYNISKFGVRAMMRNLRRTTWEEDIRVNLIAPWFIRTPILDPKVQKLLDGYGIGFALAEDAVKAVLRVATDPAMNGRSLGVVSRKEVSEGYLDLDEDDFKTGDKFRAWEDIAIATTRAIG